MAIEFPLLYIRASEANEPFHLCEVASGSALEEKKRLPHKNLVVFIGKAATSQSIQWRSHLFRDLEIGVNRPNAPLSLTCDKWGTSPVFYRQQNGRIEISSKLQELTDLSTSKESLELAKRDLLAKNFLSEGKTIFTGVRKLLPGERLFIDSSFKLRTEKSDTKTPAFKNEKPTKDWCEELIGLLRAAIVHGIESGITHAALSGGADSRLILALTPEDLRRRLTYYTKLNPRVRAESDRDFRAAQALAKEFQLNHVALENPKKYWAFLDPEIAETKVLSGLYGGEFLGGALPNMLSDDHSLKNRAPTSDREYQECLHEVAQATINSSLTIFYGAQVVGWGTPYAQLNGTFSPFLHESVIDHLMKISPEHYCRYSVYSLIWKLPSLKALAQIPFLSDLTRFHDFPADHTGLDPKTPDFIEQSKQPMSEKIDFLLRDFQSQLKGPFPL